MEQCEPCIQIKNNINKKRKKKKGLKEGYRWRTERVSGERERKRNKKKFFLLLSKIYGNRTVGFRRSKRQSRSTHRELRVGTKILEFRQTPRGREFSYLGYF